MEIVNRSIMLHPFALMHKLKEHIVSFDPKKEVINTSVSVNIDSETKDVGVTIERSADENLTNVWDVRVFVFPDQDSADFEFKALRKISDLLSQ